MYKTSITQFGHFEKFGILDIDGLRIIRYTMSRQSVQLDILDIKANRTACRGLLPLVWDT